MPARDKIRLAVVGLGFGEEFVPIYLNHPFVESVTLCDPRAEIVNAVADRFGIAGRMTRFEDIVAADDIDAVHIVSPIPYHVPQTLAVLNAGKHCACAVPMATSLDDLRAIVVAQRASGKVYMGMETAVFTRRYLYVKEMRDRGEIGRIQFLRGAHYQDMDGYAPNWFGLPPMWYATHAIAPIFALAGARAKAVHCLGSGTMREELHQQYGNPFPIETALFELDMPTALVAEVSRSLFDIARDYLESFNLFGDRASFEWEQIEDEDPLVFHRDPAHRQPSQRGTPVSFERIQPPDRPDLLPPEIARFTYSVPYDPADVQRSFMVGGGHGGSHPHLVHEFISSIVEHRQPWPDIITTANWVAAGICAHDSAMQGGARVEIPEWSV